MSPFPSYVGRNAQNTAATLWAARDRATGSGEQPAGRNTLDNSEATEGIEAAQETQQALAVQGLAKRTPQESNL